MWRLLASTCGQSATSRLLRDDGSPLTCDNIAGTVARLVGIEVRAALSQNDPPRAAFAMARAESALGTRASANERGSWLKLLRKTVTPVEDIGVITSEVKPLLVRTAVHFSPLMYQTDGSLMVQTNHGVRRVDADGRENGDDDAGSTAPSWPLQFSLGDGQSLDSILPACDRSELLLAKRGSDGQLLPTEATQFLAPRPGVCAGAQAPVLRASPLALNDDHQPIVLVEGACIAPKGADTCLKPASLGAVLPGSPRSPDGHRLVAMTGVGLIVLGGTTTELWSSEKLGNPAALSDCVLNNAGDHIACIRAGKLIIMSKASTLEAPPPAAP